MKEIKLSHNKIALVDDEDFEYINSFKWHAFAHHGNWYAKRNIWIKGSKAKFKVIYMAREIMKVSKGLQIDHINGNGLDNRRINLRICTHSQNLQNRKVFKKNKLGLKGVRSNGTSFYALISANKKVIYLGSFPTKEEAALAYNQAALKYFGEFANLNQI